MATKMCPVQAALKPRRRLRPFIIDALEGRQLPLAEADVEDAAKVAFEALLRLPKLDERRAHFRWRFGCDRAAQLSAIREMVRTVAREMLGQRAEVVASA